MTAFANAVLLLTALVLPVLLFVLFRPRTRGKTLLDGKTSEGYLTFKAAENAPPVEKQLVPMMGLVSLNFVMKTSFTAGPLAVSVLPKEDTP